MNYNIVIFSADPNELFAKTWRKIIEPSNLQKKVIIYCPSSVRKRMDELFPNIRKVNDKRKGFKNAVLDARKRWRDGSMIVKIDDDVTDIKYLRKGKLLSFHTKADKVFQLFFREMKKRKARIAGFYPTPNELWMSKAKPISTNLTFIYGACFCMIYQPVPFKTIGKVDFERSLLYFLKDGIVLRFNHYSIVSKYIGGTTDTDVEDNKIMLKNYGQYISRIKRNKDGLTSIVFKPIKCVETK